MSKINVVFDIDSVLTCHHSRNIKHASFFLRKGKILQAIKTHYIFPGVVDLIKLLFQTEDIRVSFFSSGVKERNDIFVKEILEIALGKDHYEKIKDSVTILSRCDVTSCTREESLEAERVYSIRPGNYQKDVSKVLREGESLENTVLIDDDSSYCAHNQAANMLFVPPSEEGNFYHLPDKFIECDEEGHHLIYIATPEEKNVSTYDKERVENKDQVMLIKKEEGYELRFLDRKTGLYQEKSVSKKDAETLSTFSLKDKTVHPELYKLIHSYGGRIRKIFHDVNRIYYATGLLFTALERAKLKGTSLSQELFSLQFKEKKQWVYERLRDLSKKDDFYLIGLKKLQEVNSSLEFTNPKSYIELIDKAPSKEEKKFLQFSMKNNAY